MFLKMVSQQNPYANMEHIVIDPAVVDRESTNKTD